MPFNTLVATCLLEDTSFEEKNVKVCIEYKKPNEKILFFKIDDSQCKDSELKPEIRKHWYSKKQQENANFKKKPRKSKIIQLNSENSETGNKICDLLIYFSHKDSKNDLFCLTELKGKVVKEELYHALDQLNNTHDQINNCIFSEYSKKHSKTIMWVGCICCYKNNLPSNNNIKRIIEEFETNKDKQCNFNSLRVLMDGCDIGNYLRKNFKRIEDSN